MQNDNDAGANAAFETLAGSAAVILASFAAVVFFPGGEPLGRAVVVALTAGVLGARFTDWRSIAAVTALGVLVFVGFLTHHYGTLTGDPTPWAFTPLFAVAALAGRGYRRLTHPAPRPVAAPPAHVHLYVRRCQADHGLQRPLRALTHRR